MKSALPLNFDHWVLRAYDRTKGRSTPMGALFMAMVGHHRGLPAWGLNMDILANGDIVSDKSIKGSDGRAIKLVGKHKVCTLDQLKSFLYNLAEDCKMTDAECAELYACARQFVRTDMTPGESLETYLRGEENRRKLLAMKPGLGNAPA